MGSARGEAEPRAASREPRAASREPATAWPAGARAPARLERGHPRGGVGALAARVRSAGCGRGVAGLLRRPGLRFAESGGSARWRWGLRGRGWGASREVGSRCGRGWRGRGRPRSGCGCRPRDRAVRGRLGRGWRSGDGTGRQAGPLGEGGLAVGRSGWSWRGRAVGWACGRAVVRSGGRAVGWACGRWSCGRVGVRSGGRAVGWAGGRARGRAEPPVVAAWGGGRPAVHL